MADTRFIIRALRLIRLSNTAGLGLLRVLLGVGFAALGVWFVINMHEFHQVIPGQGIFPLGAFLLAHMIVFAHVGGGTMIALGFSTRLAAAAQLPILAGALSFVEPGKVEVALPNAFAVAFAGVTIVIAFLGAGKFSLDHYLRTKLALEADHEAVPVRS